MKLPLPQLEKNPNETQLNFSNSNRNKLYFEPNPRLLIHSKLY